MVGDKMNVRTKRLILVAALTTLLLGSTFSISVYASGLREKPKQPVTIRKVDVTRWQSMIYGTVFEKSDNNSIFFVHPLEGAKVTAWRISPIRILAVEGRPFPLRPYTTYTDEDGRYSLEVSPALYRVTVSKEGYQAVTKRVYVNSYENKKVNFYLEKILDKKDGMISVYTFAIDPPIFPYPLEGVKVIATKMGLSTKKYLNVTDIGGRCILNVEAPGNYSLEFRKEGFAVHHKLLYVEPGQRINLRVGMRKLPHRIEIRTPSFIIEKREFKVRVLVDGKPVEGASVQLIYGDIYYKIVFTDIYGYVTFCAPKFNGVKVVRIIAKKDGLTTSVTVPIIPSQNILIIHAPRMVEEEKSFKVIVTDSNKIPVEDAMVTVSWMRCVFYTGPDGSVSLEAPMVKKNTTFYISASKDGYISTYLTITVINKDLETTGKIHGRVYEIVVPTVEEFNGTYIDYVYPKPVEGAKVTAWRTYYPHAPQDLISPPYPYVTYTDKDGNYRLSLKPGQYRITVAKGGYKTVTRTVYINSHESKKVDFQLHRISNIPPVVNIRYPYDGEKVSGIVTIRGTVYDPDGDLIRELSVRIFPLPVYVQKKVASGGESGWKKISFVEHWSYMWDTTKVKDGPYIIQVRAWDGKDYGYDSVYVIVTNTPPPVPPPKPCKPAVYLYTKKPLTDNLTVEFKDGKATKIVPQLPLTKKFTWKNITAKDGKIIVDGKTYDYLFYEGIMKKPLQSDQGWILEKNDTGLYLDKEKITYPDLQEFFIKELQKAGLYENEIHDFMNFWLGDDKKLFLGKNSFKYAIKYVPQNVLDDAISIETEHEYTRIRVLYTIEEITEDIELNEPVYYKPIIKDNVLHEWGIITEVQTDILDKVHDIELSAEKDSYSVKPGETITVTITAANYGTDSTASLEISENKKWVASIPDSITLKDSETTNIEILIKVPQDVKAGVHPIVIKCINQGGLTDTIKINLQIE